MARALLTATVADQAGNVVQNALVYVYLTGTTTPVSDMFAAASGGSPITTLTSDSHGKVEGWFTAAKLVDVKVTDNGGGAFRPPGPVPTATFSDYTRTVPVEFDSSVDMATQAELDAAVSTEASSRASADTSEASARVAGDAASVSTAASDATTKAAAAQAAAIAAAATDATTKANAAQSAATTAAASDATTKVAAEASARATADALVTSTEIARANAAYATVGQARPNGHLVCAIGDSNTQLPGNAGTPSTTMHDGWFPQLCVRSKQRIRNGGHFAITGAHISDVLSVQVPLLVALTGNAKPSACFILAGTNDCWSDSGTTFDITASTASYVSIITALRAVGIIPIVCLIPPNNNNATINKNTQRWNRRLRELVDRYGLVGPVDFYTPLVGSAGGFTAAYLLSDGNAVHANAAGHRVMAEHALSQGIDAMFPPAVMCTSKEAVDPTNLMLSGTGAQGLYLDTTGWSASGDTGSGAVTTVTPGADDDLVGNWHQISYNGTSTYTHQTGSLTPGTAIASHVLAFAGRVRIVGLEAAIAAGATTGVVTLRVAYKDVSSVVISYIVAINSWSVDVSDGTFYTEVTMPANAVQLRVELVVGPATAGTPIVVKVGELTVRDLTDMGVLA